MTPKSAIVASKVYTKEELCLLERKPDPCAIVIFGASGDLSFRKLFPSLFYLFGNGLISPHFYVVGVARTPMTDASFRDKIRIALGAGDPGEVERFLDRCFYLAGDYSDPQSYQSLSGVLEKLDQQYKTNGNRIFYLSTPSSVYSTVIKHLGNAKLAHVTDGSGNYVRVIIEKPFGTSLETARQLNNEIRQVLREKQIYRIDHYLGKETVQNILMFRFANVLFEPVWNRRYVDYIDITASEKLGVEHRAGYYEQAGVLRDMFQNHLLQLLAITAMEPPVSLDADTVREKRLDVIKSIQPMSPADLQQNTVCGQYGTGEIDGQKVFGYRQERNVDPKSRIATFAAIKLYLDNWRWQGVPFYIRSGKRMAEKMVEVAVHFKHVPTSIFKPLLADQLSANVLKFRIQPDEGIMIQFEAKHPGPKLCMSTVTMDFSYEEAFKTPPPESYSRLFQDAMFGDQTLFARSDEVEESWKVIDPITQHWESDSVDLPIYEAGSWGPEASRLLMAREGREWVGG